MATHRDFYDKPMYKITEIVIAFVLANVFFVLCNIPFIYYSIVVAATPDAFSVLMLFIFLIPFGPAATALCASMGKLVRDKDVSITSYYFKSYKQNFLPSLKIWGLQLALIFIFILDYRYFVDKGYILGVFFLALAAYTLIMGLYAFPILSRFNLSLKNLVVLSLYCSVKKIHITILKIVLVVATYFIYYKMPTLGIFCIFSLVCYVIMFYDNSILLELENNHMTGGAGKTTNPEPSNISKKRTFLSK